MEEGHVDQSLLTTIPTEHIDDIVSRVGASSPIYLAMCRMSCKLFNIISQAESVLKRVNWEEFFQCFRQDSIASLKFLDSCIVKGNPTALFQKAFMLCVSHFNLNKGIEHLVQASKEGHHTTTYLLRLLLAWRRKCSDNDRLKGMNLIKNLKSSIGNKIVSLRLQLQKLVNGKGLWTLIPSTICRSTLTQNTTNINANSFLTIQSISLCFSTLNASNLTLRATFVKHASGT